MIAAEPVSEAAAGLPAAELRHLIAGYSGYRQAGVEPASHRGLPSPYLTLIFTLHEPLVIAAHPDPGQPAGIYQTVAGGLHTRPALVTHDGWQSGIQVALSPLGARAILGLPAGELASIDVEGCDVLGPVAAQVQQQLREATNWPDRFAAIDAALTSRLRAHHESGRPDVSREVAFAWRGLLDTRGALAVPELAGLVGWSDRHLRARFAAEIGLTPKAAARVVRFDRARRLLQRRAATALPLRLAEVAVRCGYYDQAHLDAEFRAIAGCAPTAWLNQEFRYLQATAPAAGAG